MDYIGDYDKDRVKFMQCQDFEDETEKALELIGEIYEAASGEKVKSEAAGFHDIAIFKQGVTL